MGGNPDADNPFPILVFVVLNTLFLAGYLSLFRPGEHGYFADRGSLGEWGLCSGFSCVQALLAVLHIHPLIFTVIWWVMALVVLRLTVRQTIKLSIALFLAYSAFAFFYGASSQPTRPQITARHSIRFTSSGLSWKFSTPRSSCMCSGLVVPVSTIMPTSSAKRKTISAADRL